MLPLLLYFQDFQNPLTLENKNHVALDTILRILSQYDYLYVFESRNGLNMDYISIKGGIRDPPTLTRPFRVANISIFKISKTH